ncbi:MULTISPECIES: protein jag [Faecalicoccus]|jgi:spoIIIJ-associated protein|uniref:KH domain-containing protein n=1 Tax=Faecalicoccus pleomorphus TaxID=1323 RepID=A0A3E3E4S5_9FIRM|nr:MULTISPECIES: R3H domain-containing nucleic acid-binding protein [Faecalicoccus]MBE6120230.1 KH domain-containing protein [Erysipelotrichaceae bacterium]MCI6379354.1 Jag N-terminal domain-containing protein [Erysipelotrichaceae bacterium]MDB7984688.1 Jag N-terminal domain-containing protein [Faecalicoccus pleomorphus]MDY4870402.1 R3H domain-containing nucleic acid-binding protein [Faecalicoccus sp.]MDY5110365.1 R3H domain-containing nucleic acid-binding protein [Faecalicoccus sp.]
MEFKRYTEKTLEEALKSAARDKGVSVEDLHYNVLEEKSGFLGVGRSVEIEAYCEKDVENFIVSYIQQYFDNAQLDGQVDIENDNGFYRITVNTSNNAILIGKAGKTLQAFNRLVKAAASAEFKKRVGLLIDVNGYKEDRYEKITKMAIRVAKDVRRTKIDATLDPMPADERKAIHNALANMEDITTQSTGEGATRRLQILYSPGKEVD